MAAPKQFSRLLDFVFDGIDLLSPCHDFLPSSLAQFLANVAVVIRGCIASFLRDDSDKQSSGIKTHFINC